MFTRIWIAYMRDIYLFILLLIVYLEYKEFYTMFFSRSK